MFNILPKQQYVYTHKVIWRKFFNKSSSSQPMKNLTLKLISRVQRNFQFKII